jgi:heat shock protein HslJ
MAGSWHGGNLSIADSVEVLGTQRKEIAVQTIPPGKIFSTLLLALTMTACGAMNSRQAARIDGTSWSVEDFGGNPPLVGTEIRLAFADGSVSGNAGCNSFGGSYSVAGDRIEISDLERTLMACPNPDGVMRQEQDFIDTLQSVHHLTLGDSTLMLRSDEGRSIRLAQVR